jgi:hypothetical protein
MKRVRFYYVAPSGLDPLLQRPNIGIMVRCPSEIGPTAEEASELLYDAIPEAMRQYRDMLNGQEEPK